MPTRTIWLTAMLSAGMASALGLLLAVVLLHALPVQAQGITTPSTPAPSALPVVRAERFELVDQTGALLASLGKNEDGSVGLQILDARAQPRALVALLPGELPVVRVTGTTMSADLAVTADDEASMGVTTPTGTRAALEGYQDGRVSLAMREPSSVVRVDVNLDSYGTAAVGVVGPSEQRAWLAGVSAGPIALLLVDGSIARGLIGLDLAAEPFMKLFGPEGTSAEPIWEAP
jgi:hypothetical protein